MQNVMMTVNIKEVLIKGFTCPKCGQVHVIYSGDRKPHIWYDDIKDLMEVSCVRCGYFFNAEPLDKNV